MGVIEVDIDVKPGSDQNPINLRSSGVIPVAILTTPSFDALEVDPTTVEFEGAAAWGAAHFQDVDRDGDIDLLLLFRTQETELVAGQTEACLTGETFGGRPIQGCDTVKVFGTPDLLLSVRKILMWLFG